MPAPAAQHAVQQALAHANAGEWSHAENVLRQVLASDPNHVDALHLLGLIAQRAGQQGDAIELLSKAAALHPDGADIHAALGASYGSWGRIDEAITALRRAVTLDPNLAEAQCNLGNACQGKGEFEQAIASYDRALALQPDSFAAHRNRANALLAAARFHDAIDGFAHAIRLHPDDVPSHFQLGVAFEKLGRIDDAIARYQRTIELQPTFAEGHFNLGICLAASSDAETIIPHIAEAARLRPDLSAPQERLLHLHHFTVDADPAANFERHRRWARQFADPLIATMPPAVNSHDPSRRLRVGYVSSDFCRHSVAYFLEPLIASHDRAQVEVFCYADELKTDATTERFRSLASAWRPITGLSDHEVAQLIRTDAIDILVDLTGHLEHNRLLAFARKPAPIQVTYLGYPDTTGMKAMDYRMTDALADPDSAADALHAEQLMRLPTCAWCYQPESQSPPADREPANGPITFGCFNTAMKINGPLIELWSRILRRVPGSKMIVKDGRGRPSPALPRIAREFEKFGVESDRLELLSFMPDMTEHLSLYRRVDVALDTFPYHGTTTTCEAMWMCVPVVTLAGTRHVSRVGVSLLSAVGLPELIATSPDAYVDIACDVAQDSTRLAQLRSTLRGRMQQSPLMDGPTFARNVEAAYRQMWTRYCQS